MSRQDQFFAAIASRRLVRPAVRAIVRGERGFLVQRPTDDAAAHYAFIGGEYEVGDSFEERLRKEFEEETSARIVSADYRFVVENRFHWRANSSTRSSIMSKWCWTGRRLRAGKNIWSRSGCLTTSLHRPM
jgi:8-oxo-dGTP pyrophosphatase MutT (NUDIX family)